MNQLESALLITLRDSIKWESAVEPTSGTLTPINPVMPFDARDYHTRDRELAFRDLANAAAIMEVSIEVSDVYGYSAPRPIMQGRQRALQPWNAQDARTVNSQVLHVKNAHVPYDAAQYADRDLYGRDALIYETLARAAAVAFVNPPITGTATVSSVPPVTAWSWADGTASRNEIATALPLNRDLFRDPDMNLADRDNQMAGYVATLAQVLKNPFAYADRLYVQVRSNDPREAEVYAFGRQDYVAGTFYSTGDEVYYAAAYYRALVATSALPTDATAWVAIASPTQRVFTAEPRLSLRNRIVYDTVAQTLQWFRETSDLVHVPQLFALSIPGLLPRQTVNTLARLPVREDAQFWRQKAERLVFAGEERTDVAVIPYTGTDKVTNTLMQETGASLAVAGAGTFNFDIGACYGTYTAAFLVKPHSTVEILGGQNNEAVGGTLGGASYTRGVGSQLSWNIGLPPLPWTFQVDYTNVTDTSTGWKVSADLSGTPVLSEATWPFVDATDTALANGQLVSSTPVAIAPTGGNQVLSLQWLEGSGTLHVRRLRFATPTTDDNHYRLSGTLGTSVAMVDVYGGDHQTDVVVFDWGTVGSPDSKVRINLERAQLPLRMPVAHLLTRGTTTPTPVAAGFEGYRYDCLQRASRSVQDSFAKVVAAYGTNLPAFRNGDGTWDSDCTDEWMRYLEVYEPRLRETPGIRSVGPIVAGRQYQVTAGTVAYDGVYVVADTFWGTSGGTSFVDVNGYGTVSQVGAFQPGLPGHVGRPALVPAGLEFSLVAGTVTANYAGSLAVPQVASLQPWMVEVGAWVTQPEFWPPTQT